MHDPPCGFCYWLTAARIILMFGLNTSLDWQYSLMWTSEMREGVLYLFPWGWSILNICFIMVRFGGYSFFNTFPWLKANSAVACACAFRWFLTDYVSGWLCVCFWLCVWFCMRRHLKLLSVCTLCHNILLQYNPIPMLNCLRLSLWQIFLTQILLSVSV